MAKLGTLIDVSGLTVFGQPNREPHPHFKPGGLLDPNRGHVNEVKHPRGSRLGGSDNNPTKNPKVSKVRRTRQRPNPPAHWRHA